MARSRKYDDAELAQLKKNVSILHVCAAHGIELKRHGTGDHAGRCPLHDDDEPSFIVTPSKNLWHCMGCDKGGSVIDLVMALDGLTFRQAVDKLMTGNGLISRGSEAAKQKKTEDRPAVPAERAAQLIERAVTIYESNYTESPEGKSYLEHRGITDAGLLTQHRAGYCNGRLPEILPGNGNVLRDLKGVGILSASGGEHFSGCLVFPVLDVDGNVTTLYGRFTNDGMKRHVFLPGRPTGLWNAPVMKTYSELIVVESVLDALSVQVAGFPNVVAAQGTNGLNDVDIEDMRQSGVNKLVLVFDGDRAGTKAAARLKEKLTGFTVITRSLPDEHDPNSYLVKHGAQALLQFLCDNPEPEPEQPESTSAVSAETGKNESPTPDLHSPRGPGDGGRAGEPDADPAPPDGLSFTYGLRTYQVLGLEKGPRKLRATVRVQHAGKLHVDTLDFYSARSRRMLAQDLCRILEESPETIEADITRVLQACEKQPEKKNGQAALVPKPAAMPEACKAEAERFGRSPRLIKQILADYGTRGLVGEEPNKLLSYLAAVSRKMDEPLSVLVLSSSGAGKTALQDATLAFVPPEDLVKLTSLSGKALFYKERLALKHKVLALEEGDGAEEATYAIRNLISAGELVIESTIKDLATGRLTTMENRVEGPTSVFITTTDPETDPETKSRFFVTSIDESREQTRRILDFQRKRQTLDGLTVNGKSDATLRVHRNFQRLLKPLAVVNPFADRLTYGDDRLQGRRDQPKYLNLIKAVAFLRQMRKEVLFAQRDGTAVPYVAVELDDVRIANKLAHEILGRSLDELSRPGRALLLLLDGMVEKTAERLRKENASASLSAGDGNAPNRTSISFTRREIREATGWAHTRVHRYLKELIELEYVLLDSGRNGTLCRYRLAYEGQGKNGERFMLGLVDPDELAREGGAAE